MGRRVLWGVRVREAYARKGSATGAMCYRWLDWLTPAFALPAFSQWHHNHNHNMRTRLPLFQ